MFGMLRQYIQYKHIIIGYIGIFAAYISAVITDSSKSDTTLSVNSDPIPTGLIITIFLNASNATLINT